jgi:hypothetical protein
LAGNENYELPVTSRRCTDVIWLIIFAVANITLIAIAIYTFLDGDIERVLHGADFRGEL